MNDDEDITNENNDDTNDKDGNSDDEMSCSFEPTPIVHKQNIIIETKRVEELGLNSSG